MMVMMTIIMMTMMTIIMMMMMLMMMMMKGMRMMVLELQLHYQTDDPSQRCKRCKIVMLRELIIRCIQSDAMQCFQIFLTFLFAC